jgi:hypothetical protein
VIFALRYLIHLVSLTLYAAYGVVRFFTKPGSRVIVPAGAASAAVLWRTELHDLLEETLDARASDPAIDPLFLDALLGMGWLLLTVAYYLASRLLALILGSFPPFTRPLPPMRRLKPKETVITPAVVRVVVPPLPRRRAQTPPPWRAPLASEAVADPSAPKPAE